MKKWMILSVLILSGCNIFNLEEATGDEAGEEVRATVDITSEVTPHFEEIERLLVSIELEAGLGNLITASSLFRELMTLAQGHEVTSYQQSRMNTMMALLADTLASLDPELESGDEARIFSGSDAAAKVVNMIGWLPEGYILVYHEIPSFVGSDGLGYYVFLVPEDHEGPSETEARETFFVTDRGEIYVFE